MTDDFNEVENPTWLRDIRYFFKEVDVAHMKQLGIDLATYEGVKEKSTSIFFQTKPPNAAMPPEEDRKWNEARSNTFMNWIINDFPFGTPSPEKKVLAFEAAAY